MKGTKQIMACPECGTFWEEGAEPACVDGSRSKTTHVMHVHEDEVMMPDGTTIVAASHDERYERHLRPEFGPYLDERWSPPWPHEHVSWPDFGLPSNVPGFRDNSRTCWPASRDGQRVEVGCLGGHGRTGTLLAQHFASRGVNDLVYGARSSHRPQATSPRVVSHRRCLIGTRASKA